MGWQIPSDLQHSAKQSDTQGLTIVYVDWDGQAYGAALFAECIRPEVPAVIKQMHNMGLETVMLSGDAPKPVARIANESGITFYKAQQTPEQKAEFIEHWVADGGVVAMLGDGINDGLALQAADIGIAVGEGVDLARETADIVLPRGGLQSLPGIITFARSTRRLVWINLAWALGYNVLAIVMAAFGFLQPVIAAALMAGSSFIVIANSMR